MLLRGLTWLVGFQLLGTVVHVLWFEQVPAPILGMLLLFIFLVLRGGVPVPVAEASGSLLKYLPLILVPPAVGVMLYADVLWAHLGALSLTILASVIIGLVVTGLGMQWLIQRKVAKEASKHE